MNVQGALDERDSRHLPAGMTVNLIPSASEDHSMIVVAEYVPSGSKSDQYQSILINVPY